MIEQDGEYIESFNNNLKILLFLLKLISFKFVILTSFNSSQICNNHVYIMFKKIKSNYYLVKFIRKMLTRIFVKSYKKINII